jgi:hypothetical protein
VIERARNLGVADFVAKFDRSGLVAALNEITAPPLADRLDHLEAGAPGHVEIGDDDVERRLGGEQAQGLLPWRPT